MNSKPASLSDVAAVAHVSVSTASKVLNGGGRVAPTTRQRILDAAARLDFRPNALAQSFASGRSKTIGLLTQRAFEAFTMPTLIGAHGALGRHEMAALLYDAKFDHRTLAENVRRLQARRVDGLIIVGDGPAAPLRSVSFEFSGPVVYVYGISDDPSDASFVPDGRGAGRLAGSHLIDIGRTSIAHIGAANDIAADDRAAGLVEALDDAGLELALGQPLRGSWTNAWGAQAAQQVLESKKKVDGIFCGNDQIALGVYDVLTAAGVRVPDDIALVGYDNFGTLFVRHNRFLTTIDANLANLGSTAAEYLVHAIGGDYEGGVRYEDCTLIPGVTTMGPELDPHGDQSSWGNQAAV